MSTSTRLPVNSESIEIDLPASHRYLNVLGACIDAVLARVDDIADKQSLSYAVQLAVHEACTNIIDHAYGGREDGRIQVILSLQLGCRPNQLVVDLFDTGASFNPDMVPPPNLDEPHEHGYGLYLIRELMDDVTFTTNSRGNNCHLLKTLA